MKIFRISELDIFLIFYIFIWKFTWGRNNKPKSGSFLSQRHQFGDSGRRFWVTRSSKIFKKLRECVFFSEEYNLVIFLETKVIIHENRAKQPVANFRFLIFFIGQVHISMWNRSNILYKTVPIFYMGQVKYFYRVQDSAFDKYQCIGNTVFLKLYLLINFNWKFNHLS